MAYFRQRNNLKSDYSGYQEASSSLRAKLSSVCNRYLVDEYSIGIGNENRWVGERKLRYQLGMHVNNSNLTGILTTGSYDFVFEAIEIFCKVAMDDAPYQYPEPILADLQRAFELSGSVYFLDDKGEVELRVTEETAKKIEASMEALKSNKKASDLFMESVGDFFGRKRKTEDIISDIFIAFEDYLKSRTGKNTYSDSVDDLVKKNILNKTQGALVNKLSAYRSDVYGVAHAGNAPSPKETDALWYLETVTTQINSIERKLKGGEN